MSGFCAISIIIELIHERIDGGRNESAFVKSGPANASGSQLRPR